MKIKHIVKVVLLCIVFLLSNTLISRTVFVSRNGSDLHNGSFLRPYKTLQFALTKLTHWDTCLIREGVYTGKIKIENFNKGKYKVIAAYKNETVKFLPSKQTLKWCKYSYKIYRARFNSKIYQFFEDTTPLLQATFPTQRNYSFSREKWANIYSLPNKQIIFPKSSLFKSLYNVFLVGSCGRKIISFTGPIISKSKNVLTIKNDAFYWDGNHKSNYLGKGKGFLVGSLDFLNDKGEWFQDRNYVYYYPTKESSLKKIRFGTEECRVVFRGHYMQIKGIQFIGYKISLNEAKNVTLTNTKIKFSTPFFLFESGFDHANYYNTLKDSAFKENYFGKGIELGGENNTIKNSIIQYSWGDGVTISGEKNSVKNCIISNCNYAGIDAFGISITGCNHIVSHNKITNVGRSSILMSNLKNCKIIKNDISNAGLLCDDLGLIYTYGSSGGGTEIAYNWLHDNKAKYFGAGIYLDNNHSDFIVHNNVVWNCFVAMCVNQKAKNDRIYNNTFFNNKYSMASCIPDGVPPIFYNVLTYNNITDSRLISRDCNIFYGTKQVNNEYVHNLSQQFDNLFIKKFSFKPYSKLNNNLGAYSNTHLWYAGNIKSQSENDSKLFSFVLIVFQLVVALLLLYYLWWITQWANKIGVPKWQLILFVGLYFTISLVVVFLYTNGILGQYFSDEFKGFNQVENIYHFFEQKQFCGLYDFLFSGVKNTSVFFQIEGLQKADELNITSFVLIKMELLFHVISFGNVFVYTFLVQSIILHLILKLYRALNYKSIFLDIKGLFVLLLFPTIYILTVFNFQNTIYVILMLCYCLILMSLTRVISFQKLLFLCFLLMVYVILNPFLFLVFIVSTISFFTYRFYTNLKMNLFLILLMILSVIITPFPNIKSKLSFLQIDSHYVAVDNKSFNQFDFISIEPTFSSFFINIPKAISNVWLYPKINNSDSLMLLFYVENTLIIILVVSLFFLYVRKRKMNSFSYIKLFVLVNILFTTLFIGWISPTVLSLVKYKILLIYLIPVFVKKQWNK